MRFATILLTSLLFAGTVQAQTAPSPLTGSTGTPNGSSTEVAPPPARSSAPRQSRRRTLAERFDAANTTHDGHLTLEQARAGRMNAVARDFARIDKDHHGYVTMDDIRDYNRARREARRAARTPPAQ